MNDCVLLPFHPQPGPQTELRPRPDPWAALVEMERTIQTLQRAAAARTYLLEQAQQQQESALAEIARRDAGEAALRAELAAHARAAQLLRAELAALTASDGWRLLQLLRRWRAALAPPASLRERVFVLAKRAVKCWWRHGLAALAARVVSKTGRKGISLGRRWLRSARARPDQAGPPAAPRSGESVTPANGAVPSNPERCLAVAPAARFRPRAAGEEAVRDSRTGVRAVPVLDEILSLAPRRAGVMDQTIDVVAWPARGLGATLRCLHSLLTAPTTAYEILVVCGPGLDPPLVDALRELAAAGLITVLEGSAVHGPREMVGQAFALHPARDVVLLDTGTEVFGDWVDRLRGTAYSARDVGTVSPFANAAGLCRSPGLDQDSPLSPDHLDELCAQSNRGQHVELPAGTGPCLYMRRDCLASVYTAESESYGGTADFCRRARQRGWRHLGAVDTFVFQDEAEARRSDERWPFDNAFAPDDPLAESHCIADPAFPFRRQVDLARLCGPRPAMLFISHPRGGGTERHIGDMARRLEQEGTRVIILRPTGDGRVRLERLGEATPELVFAIPGEYWTLREALRSLAIGHVHIHHMIDLPPEVLDLVDDLRLTYDCTIHDYYAVCPRVNLVDGQGVYCGEPDAVRCNVCLKTNGHGAGGEVEIVSWREAHRARLAGARRVFVPHEDVAVRLARYFPDVTFTVRPHFLHRPPVQPVSVSLAPGEPLRVALIGHLCPHKGSGVLLDCARDALARRLPIHFAVVGHTYQDARLRELPNVSITGPYRDEEVLGLVESLRCHCAFFPAVWPETFSYTLSIAFQAGLFPVAFDLGAPAARIRAAGTGHLIPLGTEAAAINQALLSLVPRLAQQHADLAAESAQYPNLLADYYGLPGLESAVA